MQKYKLVAMNVDIPSEKTFISKYIKSTTMKHYHKPSDNSEMQLIAAEDENIP